jgi:hypothetical protein
MRPQFSESLEPVLVVFATLAVLLSATAALAQSSGLDDAVTLLRDGEYREGLDVLSGIDSADPRVDYYRGYALEKLGECDAAKSAYEDARASATAEKLRAVASDALQGFEERCTVPPASAAPKKAETAVEPPAAATATGHLARGAGQVGWRVFGWTTAILGGIVLAGVPVKSALEDRAFERTTPYFEERYGCDVSGDEVNNTASCDKAALSDDPVYEAYQQNRRVADAADRYMLIGGTTLVGVGVATLLTVAITSPSAPLQWSVLPTHDGFQAGAVLRF